MTYPTNRLIQFPSGSWGFVGRVSAELAYLTKDGQTPTDKQLSDAAHVGPGLIGLKQRSWPTKEAAQQAIEELSR